MDNLHLIQLGQYERPTITEERNKDWVSIGDNNDYYQSLINAYMDSTTNNAVINGIVNQIYGKGLDATDSAQKPDQYAQMKSLVKPHDLRNVCQDLKLLGEASFQITYNGNKISAITHFPRETLRAEKMNDNGEIKNYFYSADWTKVKQNTKLKKFPVFGSGGQNEIFIIKRYVTGFYYYSPADYNTAYATLEDEIACYLINDTQNGFSGTKVVNFNNGVPDREKQLAIKSDVMNKLSGSYGEKTIIAFNNNAESATTVTDIPLNDAPAHYTYLSEECSKKIMLTHRVTSPLLIGLRDGSGGGLGSNADEIENASRLFNNVVIQPYQNLLIDSLNAILAVNDISLNLYFKTIEPLEFMDLENIEGDEAIEEQTGIKEDGEIVDKPVTEISEDEIEQVEASYNGAQISSAIDIIAKVKEGILTKEQATVFLIQFLQLPENIAKGFFNENGQQILKKILNKKIEEEKTTELEIMASKSVSNKDSDKLLKDALDSLKGVKMDSEEFEIVDIRDLDDENESVEDWAKSMIQLSDVVDSKEDGFSTLDKSMYKVRYKYAKGSSRGGESREFCKEMMSRTGAGIVYRLEDIDKASRDMNFKAAKLPMHNDQKYDLFKFKGGVYCRHKWQQILYKIKKGKEVGSDDLDDYKKSKTIPKSYEPKPRGRKQAVKAPVNMPNNGHHPNYKGK